METKTSSNILDCIEKIFNHSKDSHLREEFFKVVAPEIKTLSSYLHTSEIEAVLFAVAFAGYYDDFDFPAVFKHFRMNEFQMMKYRAAIISLYDKDQLINKDKSGRKISRFDISLKMISSISESTPLKLPKTAEPEAQKTLVDVLEKFDQMSALLDRDDITRREFSEFMEEMLQEEKDRPIFKEIKRLRLDLFETYFMLDTIWDAVENGDNDFNTNIQRTVQDYYQSKSLSMTIFNNILERQTNLTKKNLIEISKEQYINRSRAKLSRPMLRFLRENENLKIDSHTSENRALLQCKSLPKRELFYSESEAAQLANIAEIISPKKFGTLQRRLKSKNMPSGLAVLLHGAPGTGKTESVYQLAKKVGRNIFKVDISETKSAWFGESQKLTKKIFSDYREFCETEKHTPILLFNEADAVIGKRKSAGSSNVADTENAIQNVILEEMETFDGIIFATTNLVENMDSAFERRFLFKLKFEKPEAAVSAKIWQMKLPFLSGDDALKLAEKFDFSGGEMENIARKILLEELVNGTRPNYEKVQELCRNEKWTGKDGRKIGF